MDNKSVPNTDIKCVQSLLLGEDNELITDAVRKDARNIVGEVITEAIHDRQNKDGSLVSTIAPMMEDAIGKSIENNKANFVDAMYPVVGSLVRKSVTVFFNSFLEKLNQLIEYSLTLKGIKWRIAAWRQGIPFAQYILSKTFVYRVENVLLIHRNSGTLLLDVATEHGECNDPALTSAMLTAINDFMVDSFNHDDDVSLNTIKTQELSLVITSTPTALLVAAVSGLAPSDLHQHLQQKLDDIHQLFHRELQHFTGDTSPFIQAEPQLRGFLLSELNQAQKQRKRPYFAFVLLALLFFPLAYLSYQTWQERMLVNQIMHLTPPPGIHLEQAQVSDGRLLVTIMRDPTAMPPNDWLASESLLLPNVVFIEKRFASLAPDIVSKKVVNILAKTPFSFSLEQGELSLTGGNQGLLTSSLLSALYAVPGINNINTEQVLAKHQELGSETDKQQQLFQLLKKELAALTVEFDSKSATLTAAMVDVLTIAASQLITMEMIAKQLNQPFGIVITGYSDNTGNKQQNLLLSQQRAEQVKQFLVSQQVPEQVLYAVGVGELPFADIERAARSVILSTVSLRAPNQGSGASL